MVDARVAAIVMGQEIVVIRRVFSSPDAAVTVGSLLVDGLAQAFRNDIPLEAEVLHPIEGRALIRAPAHRAVVNHYIGVGAVPVEYLHGIVFRLGLVAHAAADEADYHVARRNLEGIVLQADSIPRSRLSGDGHVSLGDGELAAELDDTGHIEHYRALAALGKAIAERAGAAVAEVGYMIDAAPAASGGIHPAAFRTRERTCGLVFLNGRNLELGIHGIGHGRARSDRIIRIVGIIRRLPCLNVYCEHLAPLAEHIAGEGAHLELIAAPLRELVDDDVGVLCGGRLHRGAAFLEFPLIILCSRDRIPDHDCGMRGLGIDLEAGRGIQAGVSSASVFFFTAGCDAGRHCQAAYPFHMIHILFS